MKTLKIFIITIGIICVSIFGILQIPSVQDTIAVLILDSIPQTELTVEENTVYMNGFINSFTPKQFVEIFEKNPNIDTLVMKTVEGSINDTANLEVATWIAKKDLIFVLEPDSEIASGGTDFFLAGKKRIVKKGAKIGVHSWSGFGKVATDFPKGDPLHQPYIDYYMAIGWSKEAAEKFYYFTINAAPAADVHWMEDQEIIDYKITTESLIK